MFNVKKATAEYTGGGFYRYTGSLGNGLYFMAADDWMDYVLILDADPDEDFDQAGYEDWQNAHRFSEMCGKDAEDFLKAVFEWIIAITPDGNYCTGDIIERRKALGKFDKIEIISECYAEAHDMTFLRRDTYNTNGDLVSMEAVGFYCGEPDDHSTEVYTGKVKAEYTN